LEERRMRDECFGLPYGGAIAAIILGAIIIIFGFAWLTDLDIWKYMWPILIIIVGVLIIAGAVYGTTRRK
jgi:hypothetical protein